MYDFFSGVQQGLTATYNRLPDHQQIKDNLANAAPPAIILTMMNNMPAVSAEINFFGNASTILAQTVLIAGIPSLAGALVVGVGVGALLGRYCCPARAKLDEESQELLDHRTRDRAPTTSPSSGNLSTKSNYEILEHESPSKSVSGSIARGSDPSAHIPAPNLPSLPEIPTSPTVATPVTGSGAGGLASTSNASEVALSGTEGDNPFRINDDHFLVDRHGALVMHQDFQIVAHTVNADDLYAQPSDKLLSLVRSGETRAKSGENDLLVDYDFWLITKNKTKILYKGCPIFVPIAITIGAHGNGSIPVTVINISALTLKEEQT